VKLIPIAITQGDLGQLTELCKEILGYSPTRGLDQAHLDAKDPASFLAVLDLSNNPLYALRHRGAIFEHISITFAVSLPNDVVISLSNIGRLKIHSKQGKRESVVILSGTMAEWYDAILVGCSKNTDTDIRMLMTQALHHFERFGFREVFNSFEHVVQPDTTIILVNRGSRS
jgi:hypothetical protein